jgi:hypothetical protein
MLPDRRAEARADRPCGLSDVGRLGRVTAVAVVVLGAVACGSDGDGGGVSSGDDPGNLADVERSRESSPFAVGREPDGYRLVQAGIGTYAQTWPSDGFGDEPVTVLAPPGESADSRDAVRISVTGFEGHQGGLAQASYGYPDHVEEFELAGRSAVFAAARTEDGVDVPADLAVGAGDDLAVHVIRREATRDELADIARLVEPAADHLEAPEVPELPDGLELVGSADADVAISLINSPPRPSSTDLPAGERGHVAVWAAGDADEPWSAEEGIVKVVTLPGEALDLPALRADLGPPGAYPEPRVEERRIADRPGMVYELEVGLRAALTYTAGGDLLMVVAMGAEDLPTADELVDMAGSVEASSDGDWDRLVAEAAEAAEAGVG